MASKPEQVKQNEQKGDVEIDTSDWVEEDRSLPIYNADKCRNAAIFGHLVFQTVLGKGENAFPAYIVELSRPCPAVVNSGTPQEKVETIPAGKAIYVHGTDLRDLDRWALDPEYCHQFKLEPTGEKIKMKKGAMTKWKRLRNKNPSPRKNFPRWDNSLPNAQTIALQLNAAKIGGDDDASFNPKELENANKA